MASTDHGHTIHDLALVVEGALHPLGPAPAASTPAYRAALRLTSILGVPVPVTVQGIEDKLHTLLIEDDHALTEVESAGYCVYSKPARSPAIARPGDPFPTFPYPSSNHGRRS
jgi:hypothetical protein